MAATEVSVEAARLRALPPPRARAEFGDRIARTFLLNDAAHLAEFWRGLAFNAELASELRLQAAERHTATIWEKP